MSRSGFPPLIQALHSSVCYPHPVWNLRVLETHISWVILTGEIAYKIKKPVDFGFLDFSTLEKRHACCQQELRLNRRLAPSLYVDYIPITGCPERPRIGGRGDAIEYAVKMWQFDQEQMADELVRDGKLTSECLVDLAQRIARFHQDLPRALPGEPWGGSEAARKAVDENIQTLTKFGGEDIEPIKGWLETTGSDLRALLDRRKLEGFVRECHGDLHLRNLVWWGNQLLPFDCIEFNEALRWIDVLSEVAFLIMDIEVVGLEGYAWRFLNAYLAVTGDYADLACFRYFLVYRATVRAKIALLTRSQTDDESQRMELHRQFSRYLAYCRRTMTISSPILVITVGLSGSGKSSLAAGLAERLGALHLRSDIERKRLAASQSVGRDKLYGEQMTEATYCRLRDTGASLVQADFSVIVDATFLRRRWRKEMVDLSRRLGIRFVILRIRAPLSVLESRVTDRLARGGDPSDADLSVLHQQLNQLEELDPREQMYAIEVAAMESFDYGEIATLCRGRKPLEA